MIFSIISVLFFNRVFVYLEPHFLHAIEYGNYVYFFLSEIAVEYTTLGKVRHFKYTAKNLFFSNCYLCLVFQERYVNFLKTI